MYIFFNCQISINLIFTRIELGTYQKPHGLYLIYIYNNKNIFRCQFKCFSNTFSVKYYA